MKTTLLPYAIQNFKNAIKCNGIFTFLILFFMTTSSYGQNLGIEFECVGAGPISFNTAPDDTFNGKVSWSNGIDSQGTPGYTLRFEGDNTWSVREPSTPNVGSRFFFSATTGALPSCNTADWIKDDTALGVTCDGVIVTCIGGTPEICDGVDNDLNGLIDDGLTFTTYYVDADSDGFGSELDSGEEFCSDPGSGYSLTNDDCNDADSAVNPGAVEILHDTIDNDCDPATPDNDGSNVFVFCNEAETKVLICHNGKDKCVSINAIDAHLAHGDFLGSCSSPRTEDQEDTADNQDITEANPTTVEVVFWPNPSNNFFNVKMITPNFEDKVDLQVFDINGRLIHSDVINGNENYQFGNNFSNGVYFVKMSQTDNSKVMKVIKH